MTDLMDRAWGWIEKALAYAAAALETVLSPLEVFGPAVVIFLLALATVAFTRVLSRFYETKRYVLLKKEFEHWHGVREQALTHPDREKGKALAANIDQARLNKAYYDFFFEGLLKNLLTVILPILLMTAFVGKMYTPENLLERFGSRWIMTTPAGLGDPVNVGAFFWFVISLILCFIFMRKSIWRIFGFFKSS